MKKFLLTLTALLLMASPALAQTQEKIAAVVNDEVITISDIKSRARLYLSGQPGEHTPQQIDAIEKQVLNKLIDERLQLQEAKKLGITVRDEDLTAGFANIAQQNKITADEFKARLMKAGAPIDSLYDQIRADIAWSQVVRRKLRPQLSVSESDIDLTMNQMAQNSSKTQRQVAEIFLAVTNPAQDEDIRREAEKIVKDLQGGASFANIARQKSQAPGAAIGGDLGWVQEGLLSPEIDRVLEDMTPGQISPPVRSEKGWHILLLRNIRQSNDTAEKPETPKGPFVKMKQLIIGVDAKDPENVIAAKMNRLQQLQETIKTCDDMEAQKANFPDGPVDLGEGPESALPEELRTIVEKLQVSELSKPIRNPAGWSVIMVCSRTDAPEVTADAAQKTGGDEPSRENVANSLGQKRLGQMAERYLRDLRATAFIDKRI